MCTLQRIFCMYKIMLTQKIFVISPAFCILTFAWSSDGNVVLSRLFLEAGTACAAGECYLILKVKVKDNGNPNMVLF
jgi:hypothetical protein